MNHVPQLNIHDRRSYSKNSFELFFIESDRCAILNHQLCSQPSIAMHKKINEELKFNGSHSEVLTKEIKELKSKMNLIDGLTNSAIETIRLKALVKYFH